MYKALIVFGAITFIVLKFSVPVAQEALSDAANERLQNIEIIVNK